MRGRRDHGVTGQAAWLGRTWMRALAVLLATVLSMQAVTAMAEPVAGFKRSELEFSEPVPVTVWNRTIVEFRVGIGEFTADVRARTAAERIAALPYSALDSPIYEARITSGEIEGAQILVGGQLVFSIVSDDVPPEGGLTLDEYAAQSIENLRDALSARVEQVRPEVIAKGVGLGITGTIAFLAFLVGSARLRRWLVARSSTSLEGRPLTVFDIDVRQVLTSTVQAGITMVSIVVALVAIYVWLSFVLSQFPYSQPVADELGRWLVEEINDLGGGAAAALPGLVTVVIIFFFTRLTTRGIGAIFHGIETGVIRVGWLVPETARTTRQLVSAVIWIFSLTVAYPYIPGSGTEAFRGISVLLGIMISLGSAGLINQIMSGFVIVYARALGVGDVVKVGETEGVVRRVGLLSTKLLTALGEEVTVPNAVVVNHRIVNFARPTGEIDAQISTPVTIGYDVPWRHVHALLLQAARETDGVRVQPAPVVLQRALSDFYVEYELRARVDAGRKRYLVLSELHSKVQDAFNAAGVQIMSPHFVAQPTQLVYVPREAWSPPSGREGE